MDDHGLLKPMVTWASPMGNPRQPPSGEPRSARCRRIFDSIWAELAFHGFLGAEPPDGSNDVH